MVMFSGTTIRKVLLLVFCSAFDTVLLVLSFLTIAETPFCCKHRNVIVYNNRFLKAAVYLNICHPTSGRGIRLKFKGYEHCNVEERESGVQVKKDALFGIKVYINCSDINLYIADVPMMLGKYCFPFKLSLLSDIPGTFNAEGKCPVHWKCKVEYWIEAEVIDASDLKKSQTIIVQKILPKGFNRKDKPGAVSTDRELWSLFRKRKIFLTARLQNCYYRTGGKILLKIIITNEPKERRVDCRQLSIKLIRYLSLSKEIDGESRCIQLDNTPTVIREQVIKDVNPEILNTGLDKIHIPTQENDGSNILPSVDGHYIQCQYKLEITATLANSTSIALSVPVHNIFPEENSEWKNWSPPVWVSQTEVKVSDNQFSVPNHILSGEIFSGMPGFQVLPD